MNESNFNLKTIENSPSNQNQAKDSSQKRFTDNQNLSPDAIGNFSEKPSYSRSSLSSHHGLISPIRQMPDLHQKSKSKALPIYNPNTADNSKRVPINPAHKHANPSFEPSAVTRSEIVQIKLVFDPPIVGTKMKAGIDVITDSGKLEHQEDFYDCDVKWFRGIKRICCVKNCAKSAEVQCITCVKLRISQYNSYFCSLEHLELLWPSHKQIHEDRLKKSTPTKSLQWNEHDGDFELLTRKSDKLIKRGSAAFQTSLNKKDYEDGLKQHGNMENLVGLSQYFPPIISNIWAECSQSQKYTPTAHDEGRQILAECTLVDRKTLARVGSTARCWSSPVLPRFEMLPLRRFVSNDTLNLSNFKRESVFRVMSFNVLADIYATEKAYPYVQKRFLRWDYRCEIVLNEIARYRSHVVCLQEVQYSHYCNFFSKQLMLYNYEGIFKKKTRTSLYSDPNAVDGCALFFDKSVFRLVQQFTIEFNEAADELFRDSDGPRKEIVRRLARDNVALVCTLEDLRTKRRVCVANTHIFWDPLYEDVKLWQTFVLCKEIQSKLLFGNSSNEQKYPIIICGDFNSTPDSQVYGLLTKGIVDLNAQLFKNDKLGIFSNTKIEHSQPFESAYKEVLNKEPSYTNYTESFKGCLDYLLFSKGSLEVLKVLDCYPENVLKEHLALPSPRFASDHIQLVAEFAFGAE